MLVYGMRSHIEYMSPLLRSKRVDDDKISLCNDFWIVIQPSRDDRHPRHCVAFTCQSCNDFEGKISCLERVQLT